MAGLEHAQNLPRVTQFDLLALVAEEIEDPDHKEWWQAFATENPVLAREVIKRAFFDSYTEELSSFEIQKRIVNSVAFAMRALRASLEREKATIKPEGPEVEETSQT